MNSLTYHLTNQAYNDLKNIAFYTKSQWGSNQMQIYIKEIDNSFAIIDKTPLLGQEIDYIRKGYFKYLVGKHLIFYRIVKENEILIVRILHQQMDVENYLS